MRLTKHLRGFLLNLIKASGNQKELLKAERAIKILDRGLVFDSELSWLRMIGYKE